MADAEPLIHAFNAGEIGPDLWGRVDQPFYRAGARTLFNAIPRISGGAEARPGTAFVAAAGIEASAVAVMDFEVATEIAYMIEAGDFYARFFRDKAPLTVPAITAAIANGAFAANIAGWTDRSSVLELPFDAETVALSPGLVVTGAPSAAFGTILGINKAGVAGATRGVLTLTGVTGSFADNDVLTDTATGAAVADIPSGLLGVAAVISHDSVSGRMSLDGLTDDYAWAEQSVAAPEPGILHVMKFAVHGVAGDAIEVRIGSTATGNDLIADRVVTPGRHCVSFTPPASPFYVGFRRRNSSAAIDDVSIVANSILEIDTVYAAADVTALHWEQSFDAMFISHAGYAPHALARQEGETDWSLGRLRFVDGPYLDENIDDAKTLTLTGAGPWAAGDTATMNAVGHEPFQIGHVGSIWRCQAPAGIFAWVTVTDFTDSANVTVRFEVAIDAALQATATAAWREGLWSDVRGYPATVTFHEGRLFFGGSAAEAWSVNGSAVGLFLTFAPDVGDGDAIRKILAGNGANAVRWLLSGEYLYAGTSKSVMRLGPRDSDLPITPASTPYKRIEGSSSSTARAVLAGSHLAYIGRHEESLHVFPNRPPDVSDVAEDLSLRASHIAERKILQMVWQASPRSILWLRLGDGGLAAVTFHAKEQVVAWSDHAIGGTVAGAAVVESIAEIPGAEAGELWMVVRRTIDGVARRYIEVLQEFSDDATPAADMWHVDSGISYSGVATAIISGLGHLEGESVNVWSEGGPQPAAVVTGGAIALEVETTRAIVGLGHRAIIAPMPIVPALPGDDAPLTKVKRITRLGVQLYRSIGYKMGRDLDHLIHVSLDDTPVFGQAPALYTGIRPEDFDGDWDEVADVVLVQDQSGPMVVLAIQADMETGD